MNEKIFQPKIVQFDDQKAKQELKKCPKIVRDYVKLILDHWERQKELTAKAIGKLRNKTQPDQPTESMNKKEIIYDPNTQTFSRNGENVSMLEINNIVQKYLTQPTESGNPDEIIKFLAYTDPREVYHPTQVIELIQKYTQSLTQQLEEVKVTEVAIKNLKSQLQQKEKELELAENIKGLIVDDCKQCGFPLSNKQFIKLTKENKRLKNDKKIVGRMKKPNTSKGLF